MGKKNPLKQLIRATTDVVVNPFRETARALGADGVVDAANRVKGFSTGIGNMVIDKASGKDKRMKQEADAANAKAAADAGMAAKAEEGKRAAAADAAIESKRMAGDSATRTLLTGGTGLEDEEDSVSRKTLRGY